MGPLAAVERFLERLFEHQSARLFRTAIRPIQVQRRLERAMEEARVREGARTVVPHRFGVRLRPADLEALRAASPELAGSLADAALAFARSHGYTLLDRPVVSLRADPGVAEGDIAIDAGDSRGETPPARPAAAADEADSPPGDRAPGPAPVGSNAAEDAARAGGPTLGDHTAVFRVPGVDGPRATIREIRPDHSGRTITFDGRPLTIGRASDNGVILRDGRASRHHARIDARRGSLVLTDLGSTNGSFVNDRRIESIALGEGDRIRLGTTTLLVEAITVAPAAAGSEGFAPGPPPPPDRAGAPADAGADGAIPT